VGDVHGAVDVWEVVDVVSAGGRLKV
jgi:hypothetical protein